jgi:uncharacterized protein
MVSLEREPAARGPVISGFTPSGFRCDGQEYRTGLILTPEAAFDWQAPALAELDMDALLPSLGVVPPIEFLLLGTGATLVHPPKSLVAALDARKIGIEPMDSRAAARSWGLLRGEDRWIAAALLPFHAG